MTDPYVPRQSGPQSGSQPGPGAEAPRHLGASEATRLLCAGTYLDLAYRDAVIDELYVHEERLAAPSPGFDAARVLAHALRARRIELAWAAAVLLLWIVSVPLSSGLTLLYLLPVALLSLAPFVRGRAAQPPWYRRFAGWLLRWYGRFSAVLVAVMLLATVFEGGGSGGSAGSSYGYSGSSPDLSDNPLLLFLPTDLFGQNMIAAQSLHAWIALALPFVLAWAVGAQHGQVAKVLTTELSRDRFPDAAADPAERAEGGRFQRLRHRIRTEQHGPLVMYRAADPFCGAGTPYRTWSLSVELRPRKDAVPDGAGAADGGPVPLDNDAVLQRIIPLVAALREPSAHGSPQAAAAVRDRLRALEIDECVFLPVAGLPSRAAAPYGPDGFAAHRARAVEEGGETRRHFLRVRVGGWGEGIVTTVFVRVHTQGGMLMLEVAPHVLWPVRALYREADRIAHRYRHNNPFGKAVWALAQTPRSAGRAVTTLWRGFVSAWSLLTGGHGGALPDGPAASVRELGSDGDASLFQEMDVTRYLKSIQDRVASGVRSALYEAGYQTDEFEQRIVNVTDGGVFIESAQGAIGIGDHNTISSNGGLGGAGGTASGTAAKPAGPAPAKPADASR
ncbi:hypothetical protein A6A06_04680 [Streptomyces sp. CB02923]|uniref:hypothetical protein n=1 Tax=Streptomyces sp. CB02923 TaxID=1718985 RepID=UPI00093B98B2|nr:hypothetical protein [Streptomyces sp. CB02923]OKI09923.1 hypothetical protein A6A06_04680 [Streptomyces sp. CB02923]